MFLLPFFIYTQPAAARALLEYRYHTMDGARRNASDGSVPRRPLRLGVGRHRGGDDSEVDRRRGEPDLDG